MIRRFLKLLAVLVFAACAACPVLSHASEGIEIQSAKIEYSDGAYRLATSLSLDLNRSLEETLLHGVSLYFKTEIEINRPRTFWFNDVPVSASRTTRIAYNVLTRQYSVFIPGTLQRNYSSLDDALAVIRFPPGWTIAEKSALSAGQTYNVSVRVMLDISQLPKPFQINALNNSDWKLASDWKQFSYIPEQN